MIIPNDIHLPLSWGWNGDTCAIWGIAIVLGGGAGKIQTARNCEARAEFLTTAANSHDALVEALKNLMADFEGRMADHENVEWHESWNKAVEALALAGETP